MVWGIIGKFIGHHDVFRSRLKAISVGRHDITLTVDIHWQEAHQTLYTSTSFRLKRMVTNTAATRVAGTLKKNIIRDIVVAFGLGVPIAYGWWYGYHVRNQKLRDAWYIEYAKKKAEADE